MRTCARAQNTTVKELLEDVYPPGPNDLALVASMALWGAVVGQLTFGFFADFVGTCACSPPSPYAVSRTDPDEHVGARPLNRAQAHLCHDARAHHRRRHRLGGERADAWL